MLPSVLLVPVCTPKYHQLCPQPRGSFRKGDLGVQLTLLSAVFTGAACQAQLPAHLVQVVPPVGRWPRHFLEKVFKTA